MSKSDVGIITRREVQDMLSDWRLVVPITLLSFLFPMLMVAGARVTINFVDDPNVGRQLLPFLTLLVGFIPSSFSLITALESFVGERERNSLESLLAMPISDRALYLGKLVAALTTPLFASCTAMLLFAFVYLLRDANTFVDALSPALFVQIMLLVITLAVTMVSASVVISSHVGNIRAANLMSSFILLPMAGVVQGAALLMINQMWDSLWVLIGVMMLIAFVLVRIGLLTFNREQILAREQSRPARRKMWGRTIFDPQGNGFRSPYRKRKYFFPSEHHADSVQTIALREMREASTDWRMLLPVFVLVTVIPILLTMVTDYALRFVGNKQLVAQMVPFVVLLVGFIPSSFSLISALESFVGERERNSLESLLAMPISDKQLYVSKLVASLSMPLVSSFTAMMLFVLMMGAFHPELFFQTMKSSPRLVELIIMNAAMTLVMVSGATVISSHTSTIRSANLLASFVLVPNAVILQIEAIFIIAGRWDVLWIITTFLAAVGFTLVRTGMRTFNREEILSREHEQFNFKRVQELFRLFLREYQPAGLAPEFYKNVPFSLQRFYRQELPLFLRNLRLPLVVVMIGVLSGCALGWVFGQAAGSGLTPGAVADMTDLGNAPTPGVGLVLLICANNLRISVLANIMSLFSMGIFGFLVPSAAFAQVSFFASALTHNGGSWTELGNNSPLQFILAYVLPHGVIELPTFILSAAIGVRMGAALISPVGTFTVGRHMLWAIANFIKIWILLIAPLVFISAVIEGTITPMVVRMLYGG